ncbi:MAG TPA: hypothetical protein DCL66_13720, partial [Gammaproteobacteria bacterium]|nr:hypothetical protein [Gammaproteobacteria bacterium]
MAIEKLTVPDLGDSNEVEVIELLVSVGQSVEENDSLLVLESDKAAMEIPAPMAGVVISIAVNLGDQVTSGSEMLSLEIAGDAAEPEMKDDKVAEKLKAIEKAEAAEEITDSPAKSSAPDSPGAGEAVSSVIEVPDLGTDDEVEVIEISVAVGDSVSVDDTLLTLESDKAAMDVPAPVAGVIEELLIVIGDKIKTGSPIARISAAGSEEALSVSPPEAKPESDEPVEQDAPPAAPKVDSKSI